MKYCAILLLFLFCSCQGFRIENRHYTKGIYFRINSAVQPKPGVTKKSGVPPERANEIIADEIIADENILPAEKDSSSGQADANSPVKTIIASPMDSAEQRQSPADHTPLRKHPLHILAHQSLYVDWELIGFGFLLSLIIPFLLPFFLWLTAHVIEDERRWWAFLLFILALGASVAAIVLLTAANPTWWIYYALAFVFSMIAVLKMSITSY